MFVRMRFRKWENAFELAGPAKLNVNIAGSKSIGFLEVFETLEDLLAEYPGEKSYAKIEPTVKS